VRGNVVMKGYYNDPEATARAFEGGWFHSGDLAVLQPDGYIKVRDRSKDIIISGGENISSLEVEDALHRHPAVLLAAVVAQPDPTWGETPCAFIELKPDMQATEVEIIRKETRSVAISFGHPIELTRPHPDFAALWLARAWLGEHRASVGRLYQELRERRGLNYGDYAYVEVFPRGMYRLLPEANVARRAQIFEVWIRPIERLADLAQELAVNARFFGRLAERRFVRGLPPLDVTLGKNPVAGFLLGGDEQNREAAAIAAGDRQAGVWRRAPSGRQRRARCWCDASHSAHACQQHVSCS